ncbi:hypothetical protein BSKO_01112 [Bryopsis sp. KO-2023]|nr:hypothetical protein BSKO_01112 [Bryopsis sp. KO-2023]
MSQNRPVLPVDISSDRAIALAMRDDVSTDRAIARAMVDDTSSDRAIAQAMGENKPSFRVTPEAVDNNMESSPFAEADAAEPNIVDFNRSQRSLALSVGSSAEESCPDMDRDLVFDQQVSIKITSVPSIKMKPSVVKSFPDEESINLSREMLSRRIAVFGLQEKLVRGDGNCQFRSISDQLYRSPKYHRKVRSLIVTQLRAEHQDYECYVPDVPYEVYLKDMARNGTWGDHVTLKAAADYYGTQICVLSSYSDDEEAIIQVEPKRRKSERALYLSFWAEIHYNSLYPDTVKLQKKKFMGSRQLHKFLSWSFGGKLDV